MKKWKLEYYYPHPNVRFSFVVEAETFEEAQRKGDQIVAGLRRTACYQESYS